MEYKIIDAEQHHVPEIEELEKQCFSMPWTAEQILSQLTDESHIFLAAISNDGKLLGYMGLMFVLDEGYISNVAIAPAARKSGIAKALINEMCERAGTLGLSFLTLEVRESNAPARSLYTGAGFSEVGLRKNYYQLPREAAILMTKYLR